MIKTVLGVTAALVCGVLAPTLASAQAYGSTPYGGAYGGGAYDSQGYYYDPCQRATTNRTTGGALAGGGIGMAIGSGIAAAAPHRRLGPRRPAGRRGRPWPASSAACAPGQLRPRRLPRRRRAAITALRSTATARPYEDSRYATLIATATGPLVRASRRLPRDRAHGSSRHQRLHPGRKPDLPAGRPRPEALRARLPGRQRQVPGRRLSPIIIEDLEAAGLAAAAFRFSAEALTAQSRCSTWPSPPVIGLFDHALHRPAFSFQEGQTSRCSGR
jgi:hypothetical protein